MNTHRANDIYIPDPYSWTGTVNVNLLDPDPDTFFIEDIARALSHTARYRGFTEDMISVGHHILIGDWIIRGGLPDYITWDILQIRRSWFLHDAPEAYLGDDQRPFKRIASMKWKRQLEDLYHQRMCDKWAVRGDTTMMEGPVKTVDNLVLAAEVHAAHRSVLSHWTSLPEPVEGSVVIAKQIIQRYQPRFVKERLIDLGKEIGIE